MLSILRKLSPLTSKHCSLLSPLHSLLPPSAVNFISSPPLRHCSSQPSSSPSSPPLALCPGCGVHTQNSSPSLPGFFIIPTPKSPLPPAFAAAAAETSLSLKSGHLQDIPLPADSGADGPKPLVCARCHSLRHYGRVKDLSAETLLPKFDFDSILASKIVSLAGRRSVVLLIVDAADFDGSFPRKVALFVSAFVEDNALAWKENKPANVPRMIVVVTKIDVLPSAVCPEMVEKWVRRRAGVLGAGKIEGVHLVSAARDWGVRNLVEEVAAFAGPRGNVWAVGAQNVGKSTLINAMGRCVGGKMTQLTEAPVPGTTLGIVRVEGVLCRQAKLFDTPGILHPYQITTRLTREEQKLVHVSKELKPRTYRIKAGHSVHIGGLMRLDVEESSADSIYLTVWASPHLPLHMGKKENSHKMIEDHFGRQLQPPIGVNRITELGKWVRTEFRVSGDSWDESSTDIAAAGLGWTAVCLKGEAVLGVWTFDGIEVVSRSSLITTKAKIFEEAGFTVSKLVSKADSVFSKEKQNKSDKKKEFA